MTSDANPYRPPRPGAEKGESPFDTRERPARPFASGHQRAVWTVTLLSVGIVADVIAGFLEQADSSGSSIVGWWWTFWIVMTFVSQASMRITLHADDLPQWIAADWTSLAGDAVSVPAAVLAILVVRGIDANQEERFRRLGAQAGTAAPMAVG